MDIRTRIRRTALNSCVQATARQWFASAERRDLMTRTTSLRIPAAHVPPMRTLAELSDDAFKRPISQSLEPSRATSRSGNGLLRVEEIVVEAQVSSHQQKGAGGGGSRPRRGSEVFARRLGVCAVRRYHNLCGLGAGEKSLY